MPTMRDLTSQRFGKLTAVAATNERRSNSVVWLCICECGKEKLACAHNLLRGDARSCGCSQHGPKYVTHGKHGSRGYWSCANMKQRCENPKATGYKNYGALGVTVCKRWQSFENFLADMGHPPSDQHSIDRINPYGNYDPRNCRWATRAEQRVNIRSNYKPAPSVATS